MNKNNTQPVEKSKVLIKEINPISLEKFWNLICKNLSSDSVVLKTEKNLFCISGNSQKILGWIEPQNLQELKTVVQIANQLQIQIYPISTGRNWGMGGALPIVSGCVIINLRQLNQINYYNAKLGLVEVQPGVTQKQLSDFLRQQKSNYYLDVTGSHELTSIVGNTLERGVAYNSQRVHAVTQTKILLANGETLTTGYGADDDLSRLYRYGIGPSLEGLFFQSSFGVVTSMTLQLNRYQSYLPFVLVIKNHQDLTEVMMQLQILLQKKIIAGVPHCFNQYRFCSALEPLLFKEIQKDNSDILTIQKCLRQIIQKYANGAWYVVGKLQGDSRELHWKKTVFKKHMLKSKKAQVYLTPAWLQKLSLYLAPKNLKYFIRASSQLSGLTNGVPTAHTVHSAYWPNSSDKVLDDQQVLSELDGVQNQLKARVVYGAPMMAYTSADISKTVSILDQFQQDHQIRIAMAFNVLSETLLEGVISFHYQQPQAEYHSQKMSELLVLLTKVGIKPYRLSNTTMDMVSDLICPQSQQLIHSIKKVLDPNGIFSPGRYGIHSDNFSH